jgi:hypothetical protein
MALDYTSLMSGNQQSLIGRNLYSDLLKSSERNQTRDLDTYRSYFTRRGLSGSGIESKGLSDYFINLDANRRGQALNVLGALTPYNQMQFQAHESQVERDWKDYMTAKYQPKKSNSWIGQAVGGALSLAFPGAAPAIGALSGVGGGSEAPYTNSWG